MSNSEDEFKRGFGKGWIRGPNNTIIWEKDNATKYPTIDKYSNNNNNNNNNKPTSGKKRRTGYPDDLDLTELLGGA